MLANNRWCEHNCEVGGAHLVDAFVGSHLVQQRNESHQHGPVAWWQQRLASGVGQCNEQRRERARWLTMACLRYSSFLATLCCRAASTNASYSSKVNNGSSNSRKYNLRAPAQKCMSCRTNTPQRQNPYTSRCGYPPQRAQAVCPSSTEHSPFS